jgi:hypothetical protein
VADPNGITAYIHCKKCSEEMPDGVSPQGWQQISIGWTESGELQVWCERHNLNVLNLNRAKNELH